MPGVARLGDSGSHGGSIITASANGFADGRRIARKGDLYDCPRHGLNPITGGSPAYTQDGRPVARQGDATACGAVITSGSETHIDNS